MKNITIDNEEKIRKLIEMTENPNLIEATKKALNNRENLTEDDVLFLTTMLIGRGIKSIIPERQYKRLVIKIWPDDYASSNDSQGYFQEKNKKYVVVYNQMNKDLLMNKNYSFVNKIQCIFVFAHELYHASQAIDSKEEKITFDSFMYSLESALQDNIPGFYKSEYSNLYTETAAEWCGIIMGTDFLEKSGVINEVMDDELLKSMGLKEKNISQFRKLLIDKFKKNHHVFANDDELKEYIKRLLKILRDNINTFSRKYNEDIFIKYPMLKYLINRTGELESPERLQELIDNTYIMEKNSDSEQRIRLLKILKELSIERCQSNSKI